MIDQKLMNKFNRIQDLPVSEEMLGAYYEGNLSDSESIEVSSIIESNPDLYSIFQGIPSIDTVSSSSEYDDIIIPDFSLPKVYDTENTNSPEILNDIDMSYICEPQTINDTIGLESSDTDVFQNSEENNLFLEDRFDTDCQSLDKNSDFKTDDNAFNENLDF